MRLGIKCFITFVIVAMVSLCASATDTTTKFETGPFTVSVDLGMQCNDTNISKPVQNEQLSGKSITNYLATICDVSIYLTRFDEDTFDLTTDFGTSSITSSLLSNGANEDTFTVVDRKINSKSGAVGSGYVPKYDSTLYKAAFYVSPNSKCWITIWDNQTKMITVLKSIKVTEAA